MSESKISIVEHTDPDWSKMAPVWRFFEVYGGPARGKSEQEISELSCAFSQTRMKKFPHKIVSPVLVVGGGLGIVPLCLVRQGHDVTTIDSCKEMVQLSQERAATEKTKIKILHGSGQDMNFPESSFNTVIFNGVISQTALQSPVAEEMIRKSHKCLRKNGRLMLMHSQETRQNEPKRRLYKTLGLNQVPSNHALFLKDGSLESVRNKFLEKKDLNAVEVKKIFVEHADFLAHHHAEMVSLKKELARQGRDPVSFVEQQFHFEKPYLNDAQQKYLVQKVKNRFKSVEAILMENNRTAFITGVK
ncbi:MAG: class I SAM-dependent methyltransferase [Candidatus Micrarchaeota archaeon]